MPTDEMYNAKADEYARRLAAAKARRRPVAVGAPNDQTPDMGGGYAQSPRPAAAPAAPASAFRELEGPNPLSSPEAAPMNPDELRALRLAARNRVFDAQRATAMARAGVRQGDPASFVNARQAEANMNDVQGDYNAARDVGRHFQTPEEHSIAIAALRKQLEQNTGATGGRVGPEVTPNPKDMATQFFLGNGAERYQGATQVATDLAGANIRRQSLNADQNAPRGAEFDSPINYEERAARLAAAKRWQNSPETTLDLQAGRDQQMLADKARRAGTEAAGYSLDTAPVVAQTGLERARRDLTAASDTVTPESETEARRSAALAATAKGKYEAKKYNMGYMDAEEQAKQIDAQQQLAGVRRSAARQEAGVGDLAQFGATAGAIAGNVMSAFDMFSTTADAEEAFRSLEQDVIAPLESLSVADPVAARQVASQLLTKLRRPGFTAKEFVGGALALGNPANSYQVKLQQQNRAKLEQVRSRLERLAGSAQ